jgi:GntR family transcriptional regulator, transcriptional repressor for pyruvate dehydrogenase complex
VVSNPKLKVANLTDQISAAITSRIAAGGFAPGSRLPTEQDLAAEFGVSRTVVREAISRLKSEGLVTTRQGAGAFVAHDKLGTPFRIDPDSVDSPDSIVEILELRLAVESEAAALAAERASRAQVQEIRAALDAVRMAFERGEDGVDEDLAFHAAIARATGNRKYLEFAEFLERYVRKQIHITGGRAARATRITQTQREHEKVVDAIVLHNADAARAAAREHFRKGIVRIQRSRPQ